MGVCGEPERPDRSRSSSCELFMISLHDTRSAKCRCGELGAFSGGFRLGGAKAAGLRFQGAGCIGGSIGLISWSPAPGSCSRGAGRGVRCNGGDIAASSGPSGSLWLLSASSPARLLAPDASQTFTEAVAASSTPRGNRVVHTLIVSVVQARNLPKTDLVGLSDPYAVCSVAGQAKRTVVKSGTLNPVYYHCFSFTILDAAPTSFTLTFFDKDERSDDPLGSVVIPLTAENSAPSPPFKWAALSHPSGGEVQYQAVLKQVNLNDPQTKHRLDDMNIVGLATVRVLQAVGLADQTKYTSAFVSFEHGLDVYKGSPVSIRTPSFQQKCAIWVRSGEEKYMLRVSLYGATSGGAVSRIGRGYIDFSEIHSGVATPFDVEIEQESATSLGDNTFSTLTQTMDADDGPDDFRTGSRRLPEAEAAAAAAGGAGGSVRASVGGRTADSTRLSDLGGTKGLPLETPRGWADNAGSLGKQPVVASIHVEVTFQSRSQLDSWFFNACMSYFDTDENGSLDRSEWSAMYTVISSALPPSGVATAIRDEERDWAAAFDTIDAGEDGKIQRHELLRFLTSAEFRSSAMSVGLLAYLSEGVGGLGRMFMAGSRGATEGESSTGARVARITEGVESADINSISVIDRATGITVEEFIPPAIKAAMKLMYKSFLGAAAVQTGVVIRMLQHMSASQGKTMDNPKSAAQIPGFVRLHGLNTSELKKPLSEFKTFNEFFYRELAPGARTIAAPLDSSIAVSPADARTCVFPSIMDAGTIWVKGSEFTVERLLGPELADLAPQFVGGSLVISRLAPQDYHRFHIPVTGTLRRRVAIDGALYTVNPVAVRQKINIYTENKRVVQEVETADFGTVVVIAVGATIVGSIHHTNPVNTPVVKGDEHGYFAFGGSTILTLFQPNKIVFDEDLVRYTDLPIETLVKMGMSLGRAVRK